MKAKKNRYGYDYYILAVYFILLLIGLYMQINISSVRTTLYFFYRQIFVTVISLIILYITYRFFDLEKIRKLIFPSLLLIIILLVIVLVTGAEHKGGVRRIFGTQPSLFARVVIILYFAHILDKKKHVLDDTKPKAFLKHFAVLIITSILVFSLIFLGRHLSILIILGFTLYSMLWLAKINFTTMMIILSIVPILLGGILLFGRDYRRERMNIYPKYSLFHKALGIETEYSGDRDYQIRESLISLASGKLFGTGPTRGTGKHYFLPEARTDYIFSIIGEEFGFFASFLVLCLYSFLFIRAILLGNKMNSLYLKLLTYGLGMNIFFNAMVNIGVSMSALPSTGVTLPFISYGGTSLLVNSFSIGLLLNVSSIRKDYREIR